MPRDPSLRGEVVDGSLTRPLRASVLRLTPTRPDEWLPGDDEADQLIHFAVLDRSNSHSKHQSTDQSLPAKVLSTCFIYAEPCDWMPDHQPAYHLRQMATDPECRSQGAGAAVIDAVTAWIWEQSNQQTKSNVRPLLWCYAREPAMKFYMKQGFECVGDVFVSETHLNIPHIKMHRWIDDPILADTPYME